jgi:uncharacterized protein YyaL (SSP411 family)
MSGLLAEHPRAAAQALLALDLHLGPTHELVIVDGPQRTLGDELLAALNTRFAPRVLTVRRPERQNADSDLLAGLFAGREADTTARFYVCQRGVCQLPTTSVAAALETLTPARS